MTVQQELPTVTIGKRTFTILFPDLLRALSDKERQGLKNSIRADGVDVPIVVDENDGIIDGGNRAQIAAEVGLPNVPTVVYKGLFLEDKRNLAIRLNVFRRHISAAERDRLTKERKERVKQARREGRSLRSIAELEGVSKSQVANDLADSDEVSTSGHLDESTVPDGTIAPEAVVPIITDAPAPKIRGRDGKSYTPKKRTVDTVVKSWRQKGCETATMWLTRLREVPDDHKKGNVLAFKKLFNKACLLEAHYRKKQVVSPAPEHVAEHSNGTAPLFPEADTPVEDAQAHPVEPSTEVEINGEAKELGKGVARAVDAINCLGRIHENDASRGRGFRMVVDWIWKNTLRADRDYVFWHKKRSKPTTG
jgi:hypothetical protein